MNGINASFLSNAGCFLCLLQSGSFLHAIFFAAESAPDGIVIADSFSGCFYDFDKKSCPVRQVTSVAILPLI